MKIKIVILLIINLLAFTFTLTAQTIIKQFQETKYNIKSSDMIDTNTGWAVGGVHWDRSINKFKSTILKTTNAGKDWVEQNNSFNIDLWDVHFINASKGWAAGDYGYIIHTEDGGEDWVKQEVNSILNFKSIYFSDESNGWAAANEPFHFSPITNEPMAWRGRIWHTTDGGGEWNEQTTPEEMGVIHRIYFQNNLNGWAIGVKNHSIGVFVDTYCAAYFTEDGGQTWVERFSPELELVFTDINFIDENHGWIAGFASSSAESGGLIFRTTDGGENWERLGGNIISYPDILWQVKFLDSQKGYAVGANYMAAWGPPVFRTMDGGETWQKIRMYEHDNHGLYGLAVGDDEVIAVGDAGYVAISTDPWGDMGRWDGEELFTQKLINILYEFEDIFFINELNGWVVGKKSVGPFSWAQVILHTDDGGQNWDEQYSSDVAGVTFRLNAVQFVSEQKGWVSGTRGFIESQPTGILYTEDGGQTWTLQGENVTTGQIVDIFFLDELNGWALTDEWGDGQSVLVLKTVNGGNSWEKINTGQQGIITIGYGIRSGKIFFADSDTGWVLGVLSPLLKTTDGGITWSSIDLPNPYANLYSIAFNTQKTGYICGELYYRTEDGGNSWFEENLAERTLTDLCFTDTNQGWMVGEWGLIYYTIDGAITWRLIENSASSAALKSVSFANENYGWATGRSGTIIKIDNSIQTMILDEYINNLPLTCKLFQNYPNPFNPATVIKYYLPESTNVKLTVYDLQGRKIAVLVNEQQIAGAHQVEFDAARLASGIYLYQLQAGEVRIGKKMIFIR